MPPTRALAPNYGLNLANVAALDLGAPALLSTNRFVVSANMKVGSYTVANASSADSLARNVVATITQVGGVNDTPGTLTITGTDVLGNTITEDLTLVANSTATGVKAFKTVTSVVGAGWVLNTGNDTIVVGTGNVVGFPYWVTRQKPAIADAKQFFLVLLGGAVVARTIAFDAADISKCTVDASAGTYNGTKTLQVLAYR